MKKFLLLLCSIAQISLLTAQQRTVTDLCGPSWRLWHDKSADWQNETLYYPYTDLKEIIIHPPTEGWEVLTSSDALSVNVPGSAEEYLQTQPGPEGDIHGVTWWTREITVPALTGNKKIFLKFGSIRQRAEIFINKELVHYEIIDNTPFEVDITRYVKPGQTVQLSIRVTDPGGNYDWRDSATIPWNGHLIPPGHAFGGVTGKVSLEVRDPLYVADIYIGNRPEATTIDATITLNNTTGKKMKSEGEILIYEWKNENNVLFRMPLEKRELPVGESTFTHRISVPDAKLWDIDNPNLYGFKVVLGNKSKVTDESTRRFGFRWFDATGIGEDAVFRLNGKRIVLRSAISWSFWPVNGIFPTDELAERQVRIAKELGLNMLNFHRFIGSPNVFDYADELGLLYYEEPGGFRLQPDEKMLNTILHEKVMRMVKRDRSHPSLVIYNLMNESGPAFPEKLDLELMTLQAAHQADPSRFITRTSAWAAGDDINDQAKIHMRPFDTTVYWNGWYDYHRAMGPATWNQDLYKGPDEYYNNTNNRKEIVFFGEEGALSSPPRLAKNKEDLEKYDYLGWDGPEYLRWYEELDRFIDRKELRKIYPTVDTLTVVMGRVSYEHQGRKIESARINNFTDAYVVNGWESELIENFSGIVDVFRYPKSTPAIISRYNQPLHISVKCREQVVASGNKVVTDFYIVNETNINGKHQLLIVLNDPENREVYRTTIPVTVTGGEMYGELLTEAVKIPIPEKGGKYTIQATLSDTANREVTGGYDEVLAVNLNSNKLEGCGAVWENGSDVRDFLSTYTDNKVELYQDNLGKLDWVIVTRPPRNEQLTMVPAEYMRTTSGTKGFDAVFFMDNRFEEEVHREQTPVVNLNVVEGANPNPKVPTLSGYGVIYSGTLTPPVSGEYIFKTQSNDRAAIDVVINGQTVYRILESREHLGDGKITLEAGIPVEVKVEFRHLRSNSRCRLDWAVPYTDLPDPQQLMQRAERDGTHIYLLENAGEWSEYLGAHSEARFYDTFFVGTNWLGGVMFNKAHPVFNELPVNDALNWPYQAVVRTGAERMGFVMEGEELLIGAYHTYPMAIGTAMGIVPVGKGKVLFSTLDIYGNILHDESPGLVAKKMILNMIDLQ